MEIYFLVILSCFLLSVFKLPKPVEYIALLLIAVFLCFGYMTGTDWISYEKYYIDKEFASEIAKTREFGYFYLQTLIGNLGVDFWTFHITTKVLVFLSLVYFVKYFKVNVFLFLALFLPEIGFYLFIDCPFRNLIALGFSLLAYTRLYENKPISYFILVFIAINFHVSAIIMILVYFIYRKDFKISFVLVLAAVVYTSAFNADFLIKKIYVPLINLIPAIGDRLVGYFFNADFKANSINLGAFIRLFVLFILLLFKQTIVQKGEKYASFFNLSILLLLIYPLGISMKILQRFPLFLFPVYILGIIYLLKSFEIKMNMYLLTAFFVALSFLQTYNIITADFRYVPYSNYLYHLNKNDLPDIEYRYQYNRKHSPYRNNK